MNEQTSTPDNPESAGSKSGSSAQQPAVKKPESTSFFSSISVTHMVLAVLVVVFIWQWQAGQRAISEMQQQLAKKIAEMDGGSKYSQSALTQSQEQVRDLAARVANLELRYAEEQNQRSALEVLYADLSVSRDESALAEVEQMLLNASQQLQLSANVKAAIIAMQAADSRLHRMKRPAFNGLRKSIGQDIDKLRALPDADIAGISSELDSLMSLVDTLPLSYRQRTAVQAAQKPLPPENETFWQRMLREIGTEMKQLVRIEKTDNTDIPLIPPNQEFFLRENLKLRLMSARLALMSRDETSFRHELKTAQTWISRFFDGKSNESTQMFSGLKKLSSARIHIDLPDISASLQAVRNYRLMREKEPKVSFDNHPKTAQ